MNSMLNVFLHERYIPFLREQIEGQHLLEWYCTGLQFILMCTRNRVARLGKVREEVIFRSACHVFQAIKGFGRGIVPASHAHDD